MLERMIDLVESIEGQQDLVDAVQREHYKELEYRDRCDRANIKLREALHDLLGPFDGRDPETDGPIDLETSGARIRKAQAVLAKVER